MSRIVMAAALLGSVTAVTAQEATKESDREYYGRPSFWRPKDKTGINVFETTKEHDTIPFQGLRLRLGAGFTQQYQNLDHRTKSSVPLYKMGPGFNLAMANLITDVQLADGIRLDLTTYLSTRHHNEAWVKGGYIQFDKLPFNTPFFNKLMEYATIKIGHMEINYGDQHFRRSDAGQGIYNPFGENLIADAFSTEIGGEIYLQKKGVFGMVGVTNGTINSSIGKQARDGSGDSTKYPAVYFKAGIDKNVGKARVRFTGSAYINNKSQRNVLYAGDRAGSWYWGALEPAAAQGFTTGRFTPNFSRNVQAVMLNGFVKYGGLEFFGTYETAKGNAGNAGDATKGIIADLDKRTMNQTAVEGLYRLGARENVYVAARYNTVNSELPGYTEKVNINRTSLAAGWFLTNNVLLKGEYVIQKYNDFKPTDIRYGGKFNGYVIEAVVGF
ncbi:hypothetical protein DRJ53_04900 [Paracnuella aquatica]|nr:hypothetical protein DRJ53_04900 [Paracnuella aquatica]